VAGGVGDGGGSKPWSEVTALTQLGKACGDGRGTLRTNGTIANGAELQKFDRNQNSDVFLIKTAEANVQTHQLADPMGETPSSHRQVFGCFTNKATPLKQSTPKLFCAKNRL